ncbi:MAG: NosD domain-containing protein [archaeon]
MNKIILISASLVLMSLILAGSASAIGCGTISAPGSYTFDAVATVSGTCVTITVSGVTLTGAPGHKIRYSKYWTGYGVRVSSGLSNVNIINMDIEQVNSSISSSYAIYAPSLSSGEIRNNIIRTIDYYGYGIYLTSGNSNTVSDNQITTTYPYGHGIYLSGGSLNALSGNTIITGGWQAYGIYLSSSSSNPLSGNRITTSGGNSHGVYFSSSSNSILTSNILNTANAYAIYVAPSTTSSNYQHDIDTSNTEQGKPIYYYDPTYNPAPATITLADIGQLYLADSPGITIDAVNGIKDGITLAMSPGVDITNNNFNVGSQYGVSGIFLHSGSSSGNILGNTITTGGTLGYGIHFDDVTGWTLRNNIIRANGAYAIYVDPTTTASYYNHDIDTSNTEQGKPIHYYYQRATDITGLSDIGQLYVADSDGITIDNINGIKDGITLARTDNSVVSGSTTNAGSQSDVRGIYLHSSSNFNDITGNTITVAGYGTEGIYLSSCPSNTIQDNTVTASNTYSYGIYLSSSGNSYVLSNIIDTYGLYGYGVYLDDSANSDASYNSITTSGSTAYGIHLDSTTGSFIKGNDIMTAGSVSHGIYLDMSSDDAGISDNTVATSNTNAYGIYLYTSGSGNISGNIVTTGNSNSNGIYVYSSGDSVISYNDVTTSGADGHGIYLRSSDTNTVSTNVVRTTSGAGSGSRATYIRDSDSNILQDNIFDGQGSNNIGLYLSGSYNNNITGGSILGTSYDVSLGSAGATNNFTDAGFSMGVNIQFRDTTSWFNYNNESSGSIWLMARSSQPAGLERTIETWNDMLMKWTETGTPSVLDVTYEIRGLIPNMAYAVFQTSGGVMTYLDTYTSDSAGTISFSVTLDGMTTIEINGDTTPPIVTVINYPDPVVADGIETFEVTCDDGPTGSGCDKTTISTSHYTCIVDHRAIPPETNCTMDLTAACEAKTYIYSVDSVDLAHNHNTSVNGSFEVKKADGCNCISSDECFRNSCLSYTICADSESPDFDLIVTTPENEFETQFVVPLGKEKTILLNVKNPLPIPDTITLEFEGSPPNIENWLDIKIPGSSGDLQYPYTTKKISVKPHSETSIPITVFAGKVGAYSLTMNARSATTGQRTYNTTRFSIIYAEEESINTQSPGLGHASIIILLFISAILLQKKEIS